MADRCNPGKPYCLEPWPTAYLTDVRPRLRSTSALLGTVAPMALHRNPWIFNEFALAQPLCGPIKEGRPGGNGRGSCLPERQALSEGAAGV
jgi:hypothetical protein